MSPLHFENRSAADAPVCTRTFQDFFSVSGTDLIYHKDLLTKTMICTFVGCLHISPCSRQNWSFVHLTASCLHISCWYIYIYIYIFTDLYIWGRHVCTNVVACTFEGEMFAQMWVFAHFTAPQGLQPPYNFFQKAIHQTKKKSGNIRAKPLDLHASNGNKRLQETWAPWTKLVNDLHWI